MTKIVAALRNNPVRIYSLVVSVLAVAGSFGVNLSESQHAAVLGLVVVVLGGGEVVRAKVAPT